MCMRGLTSQYDTLWFTVHMFQEREQHRSAHNQLIRQRIRLNSPRRHLAVSREAHSCHIAHSEAMELLMMVRTSPSLESSPPPRYCSCSAAAVRLSIAPCMDFSPPVKSVPNIYVSAMHRVKHHIMYNFRPLAPGHDKSTRKPPLSISGCPHGCSTLWCRHPCTIRF
jgi:hypothetical protein